MLKIIELYFIYICPLLYIENNDILYGKSEKGCLLMKNNILKLSALILALLSLSSFLFSCKSNENENDETTVTETKAEESTTDAETDDPDTLAPDAVFYDIDGNKLKISDFIGKPVILNFWASWCPPCKGEMPDFNEAYKEYGDSVHFIMVNLTDGETETVDIASKFIADQGYSFPIYFDSDIDCVKTYGITSIPVTYFIDAKGYLVAYAKGAINADTLKQGIDMLTKEN